MTRHIFLQNRKAVWNNLHCQSYGPITKGFRPGGSLNTLVSANISFPSRLHFIFRLNSMKDNRWTVWCTEWQARGGKLTLRKIANSMSKNCPKIAIFSKKNCQKIAIFFSKIAKKCNFFQKFPNHNCLKMIFFMFWIL